MRARYSALAVAAATALLPAALVAQTAKGTTAQADPATRFFATAPWATSGPSHIIDQSAPLGGGPANDACGSVTPEALAIGGSLTFTGSTTGATNTGDYAPGSVFLTVSGLDHPTVWHAFTLSQTADVTVSYCNTNPGFSNVWAFLAPSCPADDDAIIASVVNWELCAEENITMVFPSLAAGTYYLPVMYNATDANGPYSIEVSAATFNPYCATWVNMLNAVEPICHVQFAGIDNTSCSAVNCGPALEDFTNTPPAEVVAGQTYALSVSGNTDGNYNNYISVFFDWDQDEVFDTGYGVGAIANTNCGQTATAQIPIPANVPAGTYRMRVVKIYAQVSDPPNYPADPCSEYSYGQAEDYLVNVSESGGGPANDDCANATAIGDGVHAFSSEGATGTDITSCTFEDSNDIWFVYTATCTGLATASTCGDADFDTALSVWSACGGDEIVCNDDATGCAGNTSSVSFPVTSGTTYWIRVAGYNGATGTGNLTVGCDDSVVFPENDDCANATAIGDGMHAFSSENATGTDITSCTFGDSNDIWFVYTATCTGLATASTCDDADFDTALSAWSACGGSELACNDDDANCDGNTSVLTFPVVSGNSYWIRVAGYNGATGTGNLTISCTSVSAPANDDCANAISLVVNAPADCPANAVEGDNSMATQDGGDPDCDTTTGQFTDVWYSFNSGDNTTVTVNIGAGTMEDLVLEVLDGCGGASVYCEIGEVANEVAVTENTDYLVRVMSNTQFGNGGTFTICITGEEEGPTDDYCTAGASGVGLGLEERIINVTFSNINNDSPNVSPVAPAYQDFTSVVGDVTAGQSYAIGVDVARNGAATSYSENQVLVWIDLDQNGDFDGAGELVFTSQVGSVDIYEGSITIPANATLGMTRMRIRLHDVHDGSAYTNDFNDTPCGLASYGEVEDYSLNIDFETAVHEEVAANWSVFPNPGNGDFTITSGNVSGKVQVEVLDMTGRLVGTEQHTMTSGGQTALNMAGRLAAGTYVLRLTSEAGRHEQRIVVR
jgi:hypothetical protein